MLKCLLGFDFGAFPIYQLMLIAAFVAGWITYSKMFRRGNFSKFVKRRIRRCFFWGAVCGLIASNAINWLFYDSLLHASLHYRITQGVYSSFFGLLAFYSTSALFLRMGKMKVKLCLNYVTPAVLLALFLARLGCTLGGCCYGRELTMFGATFRFPTTELEAIYALTLFIILRKKAPGKRFWIFTFSYTALRFVLEFLRGDDRGSLLGFTALTPVQIAALVIWIISAVALFKEPFCRYFLLEHKLLQRQQKRQQRLERKGKKPYVPLPYDYTPAKPNRNPLHPIGVILLVLVVLVGGMVYINPFGSRWCQNLQYSLEEAFAGRSQETQTGQLNGQSLQDASGMGTAKSQTAALEIIESYDTWANAEFDCTYMAALPNGNHLYGFMQQVEGKPVFGTGRVLVTDSAYNALYVAGDAAGLTYTKEVVSDYALASRTVASLFGEDLAILESMDGWYDTAEGLVAARHVILSSDGNTAAFGAVIDSSNGGVITLTGTQLGVCNTAERNRIQNATGTVYALLAEGDLVRLEELKADREVSELEQDRYTMMRAIIRAYEKSGLTAEEFCAALASANEIADRTPDLNQVLYGQILAQEVRLTLRNSGAGEKAAQRSADKVESAFRACGIKQTKDKTVTQLTVRNRKASFRHSLNGSGDSDVFTLSAPTDRAVELTLQAAEPVKLELYEAGGNAVTTLYVEGEETVILYPEDGSDFTLRVCGANALSVQSAAEADYKLSLKSTKLEETIPAGVTHSLRVIEDSFNNSNAMTFFAFCLSDLSDQEQLQEVMAAGMLAPVLDSCSGCIGLEENVDVAKTLIAMTVVPGGDGMEALEYLRGAQMDMEYFAHMELENSIAVKAKLTITIEEFPLYDGYVFYELGKADRTTDGMEEQTAQIVDAVGSFIGTDYYITAFNTDALYQLFGDTAGSIGGQNDLESLYELQETVTVEYEGMTFRLKRFNEQQALRMGHSREKVDSFYNYTLRQNILKLKEERATHMAIQICHSTIADSVDAASTFYEVVTDPAGVLIEAAVEGDQTAEGLYATYELVTDPAGVVTDIMVDSLIDSSRSLAEAAQWQIDAIDALIADYESKKR